MNKVRKAGRPPYWVGSLVVLAIWLALACGSVERDSYGQIINSGNLDISEMLVGDCFQALHQDLTLAEDVSGVPCSTPHDHEVFHLLPIEGDEWPGDDAVEAMAVDGCLDAFEPYVGAAYEDSSLDFSWFSPTQRAFEQLGYRHVVCVIVNPSGAELTGSVKAAAQ
jgi:hypothetical protein